MLVCVTGPWPLVVVLDPLAHVLPHTQRTELQAQVMELRCLLICCQVQGPESLQRSSSLTVPSLGKKKLSLLVFILSLYFPAFHLLTSLPILAWERSMLFKPVSHISLFVLSLVQICFDRCDYCFLSMQKNCLLISVNPVVSNSGLGRETSLLMGCTCGCIIQRLWA